MQRCDACDSVYGVTPGHIADEAESTPAMVMNEEKEKYWVVIELWAPPDSTVHAPRLPSIGLVLRPVGFGSSLELGQLTCDRTGSRWGKGVHLHLGGIRRRPLPEGTHRAFLRWISGDPELRPGDVLRAPR